MFRYSRKFVLTEQATNSTRVSLKRNLKKKKFSPPINADDADKKPFKIEKSRENPRHLRQSAANF
jgi:protein-arginine kinase